MRGLLMALGVLAVVSSPLVGSAPARAASDFDSAYVFESAYLANMAPGDIGTFSVFFQNTGALTWVFATETQVNLASCRLDKVTCGVPPEHLNWNPGTWLSTTAYATQSKLVVVPGDSTSFFYQVKASTSTAPGTYRFNGDVVVAATGALIHPEGYYQEAFVTGAPDQAPSDLQATIADTNSVGGPNDVRLAFTAPARNVTKAYDVQRREGDCSAAPADTAFVKLTTVTAQPGQSGSYVDLDRTNGTYCYQVRVPDPARSSFLYSNQPAAVVTASTIGVVPMSTSTVMTASGGIFTDRYYTGDKVELLFNVPVTLAAASIRVADSDCGAPTTQAGPPATCMGTSTSTTADVVCGVNASCVLSLDRKTLTIMLTAPPTQVAAGSVAGLQYPITIIEGHGITDANGTAWDLAGSADRVFGPVGQ